MRAFLIIFFWFYLGIGLIISKRYDLSSKRSFFLQKDESLINHDIIDPKLLNRNEWVKRLGLRNNHFWLTKYGTPESFPPIAWCTRVSTDPLQPVTMIVGVRADSKKPYNQPNKRFSSWDSTTDTTGECDFRFYNKLFTLKNSKVDGWIASSIGTSCGGYLVRTPKNHIYTNIFRPSGPDNDVIVSCTCPIHSNQPCTPSARWEKTTLSTQIHNAEGTPTDTLVPLRGIAGGYTLGVDATVGHANEINLHSSTDRLLVEAHVYGLEGHVGIRDCSAKCADGGCEEVLIRDGRAVNDDVDLRVFKQRGNTFIDPILIDNFERNNEVYWGQDKKKALVFSMRKPVFLKDIKELHHSNVITLSCHVYISDEEWDPKNYVPKKVKISNIFSLFGRRLLESGTPQFGTWNNIRGEKVLQSHHKHIYNAKDHAESAFKSSIMLPKNSASIFRSEYETYRSALAEQRKKSGKFHVNTSTFTPRVKTSASSNNSYDHSRYEPVISINQSDENEKSNEKSNEKKTIIRYPLDALEDLQGDFVLEDTAIHLGKQKDTYKFKFANDEGFIGGSFNPKHQATALDLGLQDTIFSAQTDPVLKTYGLGFVKGNYGVNVNRSDLSDATMVEVLARGVETSTLADLKDKDFGQRVKVRDLEVSVRHDLDEIVKPDEEELATSISVFYQGIGVAVDADPGDTEYGVKVGVQQNVLSILKDFDQRHTELQGNFGDGWQTVLETDFQDPYSDEVFFKFGFGKLGDMYMSAGAGIEDNKLLNGTAEVHMKDIALTYDMNNEGDKKLVSYSVKIGKFSYVFDSKIIPESISSPLVLGIDPLHYVT